MIKYGYSPDLKGSSLKTEIPPIYYYWPNVAKDSCVNKA